MHHIPSYSKLPSLLFMVYFHILQNFTEFCPLWAPLSSDIFNDLQHFAWELRSRFSPVQLHPPASTLNLSKLLYISTSVAAKNLQKAKNLQQISAKNRLFWICTRTLVDCFISQKIYENSKFKLCFKLLVQIEYLIKMLFLIFELCYKKFCVQIEKCN